jgi:phosphate transport system protein
MSEHIVKRYDDELEDLKKQILEMGGMVERMIATAMRALTERDATLAREVLEADNAVNRREISIDALAVRLLALRQPAARDLRLIATAMKINTDLERIGDTAVNMSERALELLEEPQLKPYVDLPRMGELARNMLKNALDAFVEGDVVKAQAVRDSDDEIDDLYKQIHTELVAYMQRDPQAVNRGLKLIFIAKYLERIADHATNLAEMVTYLIRGDDVRHAHSRHRPGSGE